jgi:hypothetical protein
MNTHQRGRGHFEERLLEELRSLVVAGPSSSPRVWVTPRSRRRLGLAGGVAALLAAAAGAGVPFLVGGAAPAYAVNTNDDGTVSVEINSLSDAAGLQSKLRQAGVPAVVQYLEPGKACKQPWFTPASPPDGPPPAGAPGIKGGVEHTSDGQTRFTISKNLPADETLVIMTQTASDASVPPGAGNPESIGVALAKGEVPPCEIVDAPAGSRPLGPPPPGAQLQTNGGTPGPGTSTAEPGSVTGDGSASR